MQVLIAAVTDQNRPKSGLPDAVPLPEPERRVLEPLEQRRQPAGDAVIVAQFIDHGRLILGAKRPTLTAARRKAIGCIAFPWRFPTMCRPLHADVRSCHRNEAVEPRRFAVEGRRRLTATCTVYMADQRV